MWALPQPAMHRKYSLKPLQGDEGTLERFNAQSWLTRFGRCRSRPCIAMAHTVWALAAANHALQVLFDAIAESCSKLERFNAQKLAYTVGAFAAAHHASQVLVDAIVES
eukprot:12413060-Karenia_brevis.AAC.1